ncbi:hypothetical protein CRENBAI_009885 [Crenichthys baileyi]|uniref:Uncharacterized protein n=1 Tax=Crenichthys baileyi TaxID=28760 RepID=A0AAV9SQR6_9TELE
MMLSVSYHMEKEPGLGNWLGTQRSEMSRRKREQEALRKELEKVAAAIEAWKHAEPGKRAARFRATVLAAKEVRIYRCPWGQVGGHESERRDVSENQFLEERSPTWSH